MSTDVSLHAVEIIRLYGLRFKIEHGFKQAIHVIGSFAYHFWMRDMKALRRRNQPARISVECRRLHFPREIHRRKARLQ